MIKVLFLVQFIFALNLARADTPAPGIVKLKGATDSTLIGNVSDSLKVDVTNDLSITFPDFLPVSQYGTWSVGRTWNLLYSTDSVTSYQGGLWDISIMNFPSSFIANIGTTGGLALDSTLSTLSAKFGTIGQHNSAGSTSVVLASDQGDIGVSVGNFPATQPVSGTVTVDAGSGTFTVGQSLGSNLHTDVDNFPSSQNVVVTNTPTVTANAGTGSFTVAQPTGTNLHVVVDAAPATKAPINPNASFSGSLSVTTSEGSTAAPANAIGVVFEAESGNATNIRWGVSNSGTGILSTTSGMLMEPGRSIDYLPIGTGTFLHYISTAAGTNAIDIQWVLSQ